MRPSPKALTEISINSSAAIARIFIIYCSIIKILTRKKNDTYIWVQKLYLYLRILILKEYKERKMESFATLIQNRRSTRKFTEQLLSPEQVELILKAALMAPASKRSNPWQFVVVEDKGNVEETCRV